MSWNENNSNVVEPEPKHCCIPEKPNLKSATITVEPYEEGACGWGERLAECFLKY
jgi:hypothetical protein